MYNTGDNNVTELFNAELLLPHNSSTTRVPNIVPTVTTWYDLSITNTSLIWSWLDLDMDWSQVLNWQHHQCHHWQPLQQLYYQVAHLVLLLCTLIPLGSNVVSILVLRSGLVAYSLLLVLWSTSISCSLDTLVWGATVTVVNLAWAIHTIVSAYTTHCAAIHPDIRAAYDTLFKPLGVSTKQFKKLLDCTKELKVVSPKETVITEKISRVDCLSLVLSGRLIVSQGGRALHLVNHNQFLDSPEWFGVTTDEFFQVTVTALETCSILSWHRDRVKFCLMEDTRLQAIFDHIVGRDVVRKLMQVNNIAEELKLNLEKIGQGNVNGDGDSGDSNSAGSDSVDDKEDCDDKKPMITKDKDNVKEKSLLGSLIGGEIPNWRLVNIKETEDETIV